jgi:Xaa-Pro aminopeptidase
MDLLPSYSMVSHDNFIVGVDGNAGNPHYEPTAQVSASVGRNQLLLLDLWAKLDHPDAPFGDITWMAFIGPKEAIPEKYHRMFGVLVEARDKTVAFLRENIEKRPVFGFEVDDVCRNVVKAAGFGDYFTHRTGHSITTEGHGAGPNIDNLETEDRRRLQKGHLFSIEPGIYMTDCGFRTEIDCLISHEGCEVTTLPLQMEITPLF